MGGAHCRHASLDESSLAVRGGATVRIYWDARGGVSAATRPRDRHQREP
jgi:hypothetical protein